MDLKMAVSHLCENEIFIHISKMIFAQKSLREMAFTSEKKSSVYL